MKKIYCILLVALMIGALFLGGIFGDCFRLAKRVYNSSLSSVCGYCDEPGSVYINELENYFCYDCYEVLTSCFLCLEAADNTSWREEYNKFCCDACYNDLLTCDYCMKSTSPTRYLDVYSGFFCDVCINKLQAGDFDQCSSCGKIVDYELYEITEEDFECKECYTEHY